MKKFARLLLTTLTLIGFSAGSAFAMDLDSAKRSGLVGEKPNGLIEATLPNPSSDLENLINTTNSGRMEVYKSSAEKQNIPVKEVQAIAAKKIYERARPGDFLMINGKWEKK